MRRRRTVADSAVQRRTSPRDGGCRCMTANVVARWRTVSHDDERHLAVASGMARRAIPANRIGARVWYGTEPQQRPPRACVPYRGTVAKRKRRNSKGRDCVPYHGTVRCAWRRPHRIPYRDVAGRWTRRGMLSGGGMPGCRPVRIGCRPACIGCRPRHRNGPVRIGGIDRRPVDRGPDAGVSAVSSGAPVDRSAGDRACRRRRDGRLPTGRGGGRQGRRRCLTARRLPHRPGRRRMEAFGSIGDGRGRRAARTAPAIHNYAMYCIICILV